MNESQILAQAIGEYTVDTIGRDQLRGLQVNLNSQECAAFVTIALINNEDESQRLAIRSMFDVENVFADEASLSYVFVDAIPADASIVSATQYSYA